MYKERYKDDRKTHPWTSGPSWRPRCVRFLLPPSRNSPGMSLYDCGEEMEVQTFSMRRILGSLPVCLLRSLAPCRWSTPWNIITFVLSWFDQKWCCWELGWNQCSRQWYDWHTTEVHILVQIPPVILGHTQRLSWLSTCGFVLNYLFLWSSNWFVTSRKDIWIIFCHAIKTLF